jgi:hypothetical protein
VSDTPTRLDVLERKLFFVMQTLSLTQHLPDGQTNARSLTALYEEMQNHDGSNPQTFADVAQRAFSNTSGGGSERPRSADGPDGFPGTNGDDPSSTTG